MLRIAAAPQRTSPLSVSATSARAGDVDGERRHDPDGDGGGKAGKRDDDLARQGGILTHDGMRGMNKLPPTTTDYRTMAGPTAPGRRQEPKARALLLSRSAFEDVSRGCVPSQRFSSLAHHPAVRVSSAESATAAPPDTDAGRCLPDGGGSDFWPVARWEAAMAALPQPHHAKAHGCPTRETGARRHAGPGRRAVDRRLRLLTPRETLGAEGGDGGASALPAPHV